MSYKRPKIVNLLTDAALVNLAVIVGLALRFDSHIPPAQLERYGMIAPWFTLASLGLFQFFGLYQRIWTNASAEGFIAVVAAVSSSAFTLTAIVLSFHTGFPRSVLPIYWLGATALVGFSRFRRKLFDRLHTMLMTSRNQGPHRRVLVVGAGEAGSMVVREMLHHPELEQLPVGLLDDVPGKRGLHVDGIPVVGSCDELEEVVHRLGVEEVVIAMPSAGGAAVRRVVENCRNTGVKVRTVPGVYELVNGQVTVSQIREVQIEDLLGREPVELESRDIADFLSGQTVLVTGAGGSIGSEICRQMAHLGPRRLILLGHGENSIFEIHLELLRTCPGLELVPIIADVQDARTIDAVFKKYHPQVVFHAAAHKHVPLMELHPLEAVKNNVFGTRIVADAAVKWKADRFVLISTDKAVKPKSVMGLSKRMAELVTLSRNGLGKTRLMVVRFGNVLGSRGSVIPIFKRQIARGGPVTVTHPEMCRYFMTIPEAARLVIQAGAMGQGEEVFVLDMGEPVKIVDLARNLIRLSGFEPDKDIALQFTGIRPGEKLFEELLTADEGVNATSHQRIFIAHPATVTREQVTSWMEDLSIKVSEGDEDGAVAVLRSANIGQAEIQTRKLVAAADETLEASPPLRTSTHEDSSTVN